MEELDTEKLQETKENTQDSEPAMPETHPLVEESKKNFRSSVMYLVLLLVLAAIGIAGAYGYKYLTQEKKKYDSQISGLTSQVTNLQKQLTDTQKQTQANTAENQHLQEIHAKSQDQILTDAVAKVTPAVVSIVVSKDVPNLSVTYENPFGNDPFFQDFGFQVPVYHQNGTTHQEIGAGSGFLITANGYILTNKHVVFDDAADYTVLLSSGKQQTAKVIYKDPTNDIAIVKIDGTNFTHVDLGDSASLKLGQTVAAIGNALGEYNNSVSVGIISGLNRTISASGELGTETLNGVLQTDAAINPGNSGGPLIDLDGNVIGINVATVQGSSNISFSIPINTVKSIVKSVLHI